MRRFRFLGWFMLFSWMMLGLMACPQTPANQEEVAAEPVGQEVSTESVKEETVGSEPAVEPVAEPVTEPTVEPAVEPVAELVADAVADASVEKEPTPEPTVEPTAELAPEVVPEAGSPLTLAVSDAKDVVASYLLSGSAWNYFGGATVPLGRHFGTGNPSYHAAFRFTNVRIPQGATITSAYLSFVPQNEVDSSNRLMLNVYAEKVADSSAYDPMNYTQGRPDQRSKTTAKIDRWIVRCNADCSDDVTSPKYEYDCPQRNRDCWNRQTRYQVPKDLKDILQEVFSQTSWKSGHAISIFLINAATDQDGDKYKGSRTITGFDPTQTDKAPQLVIQYQ
ncbi:MAG: hypothetical protein H6728_01370 [Myxococcales bacterium]|nr:hypothetical protein [Myxococcales bacterium]